MEERSLLHLPVGAYESDDPEHGMGYTNGHDWFCMECYERFWDRPDFSSSSHIEIT